MYRFMVTILALATTPAMAETPAFTPDGTWRRLAAGSGATAVLKTRHKGWLDIAYGGPGMQAQPVLKWNGASHE